MSMLRGISRTQSWNNTGYVCLSCRHKLLTSRSQQQLRWQGNLAPSQYGDDDWASNFNDLSTDNPPNDGQAPTSSFMLEARTAKGASEPVLKKTERRRRMAQLNNKNNLASLKSNLGHRLDHGGVSEKKRAGDGKQGTKQQAATAGKPPSSMKSKRPDNGGVGKQSEHKNTKDSSGVSSQGQVGISNSEFGRMIERLDEKKQETKALDENTATTSDSGSQKSKFASIVDALKSQFAKQWPEMYRTPGESTKDTASGASESPESQPAPRTSKPEFGSSSSRSSSRAKSMANTEKPLTLVQKVKEAKNRPKWGGIEMQTSKSSDGNSAFLDSLDNGGERSRAESRARNTSPKSDIVDKADQTEHSTSGLTRKHHSTDIRSLKDRLSGELGQNKDSTRSADLDSHAEPETSKSASTSVYVDATHTIDEGTTILPLRKSYGDSKLYRRPIENLNHGSTPQVRTDQIGPPNGEPVEVPEQTDEASSRLAGLHPRKGAPSATESITLATSEGDGELGSNNDNVNGSKGTAKPKSGGRKKPRKGIPAPVKKKKEKKPVNDAAASEYVAKSDSEPSISNDGDGSEHKPLWEVMSSAESAQEEITASDQPIETEKSEVEDESLPLDLSSSEPAEVFSIQPSALNIEALNIPQPPVPGLEYGLDRVLFNPGVYQLQDPHSRVYNFDPYLQNIMPVSEFDFNALKEYKTSSQDTALAALAKEHDKRYIGSTSSMTGTLAHFHYLISDFRPLNLRMLSRGFPDKLDTFTKINMAPNAIFLRWKNGTYAIDADKEFDGANVLMMLGKSMEKLLTLPTTEYEKYRKSDPRVVPEEERQAPESYEYTTMGDFLMRSQLDAYDPRLPGTGMFDLKTRAVVSVRMKSDDFQPMSGYEIHTLQGRFESYEREYYDMLRSTLLKYMLQARMGRMDGIFLAYHNVERIFGFQYMSMHEMDRALHGQYDRCLGDQEFKTSLDLMNKVFDKATAKFPEQSLRFHFETKSEPLMTGAPTTVMWIFAEPMSEDEIESIQAKPKAKIAEFERTMMGIEKEIEGPPESDAASTNSDADQSANESATVSEQESTSSETSEEVASADGESSTSDYATSTSSADPAFVNNMASASDERKPLFIASLICKSRVNETSVPRPETLKRDDTWEVEYLLQEWEANDGMWARYEQTKAKRKETLEFYQDEDEDIPVDEMSSKQKRDRGYIEFLRDMSKRGREFRGKMDELEAGRKPVVVGQPVYDAKDSVKEE